MTHGSLFSGIGGFDLAASWMGWENIFHCENNKFCKEVLKYYWPNAESYDDIKQTDFTIWKGRIDVLSGGFPCQPFSNAGRRKGTDDNRYLWPQMLDAIKSIQPIWIVGENVYGILNWSKGMVFKQVQTDLENQGYGVFPIVLPACGVGADHIRRRVWFIAHANSNDDKRKRTNRKHSGEAIKIQVEQKEWQRFWAEFENNGKEWNVADTNVNRQQKPGQHKQSGGAAENKNWEASISFHDDRRPTVSPVFKRNDGISFGLDIEAISEKDWLEFSHTAIGNAIVPQVAYEIFKAIELMNKNEEINY